jgi:hypothetical protein
MGCCIALEYSQRAGLAGGPRLHSPGTVASRAQGWRSAMTVITVERDVAATAEKVWAIVTDLERTKDVISAITALERTDEGSGFGVGTAWQETRVMFGREATESMAVTEIDAGRSYVVLCCGNRERLRIIDGRHEALNLQVCHAVHVNPPVSDKTNRKPNAADGRSFFDSDGL